MNESSTALSDWSRAIGSSSSCEDVACFIDRIKADPHERANMLVPLLSERHPIYQGRSTGEAVRLRGYAMAALERTGLPDRALPYVLESLESTFHPYLVAAAARALRGMKRPNPQISHYLIKAVFNIWQGDNPVSFDSYHVEWPQKDFSTALTEIFETAGWLGSSALMVLPDLRHLELHFAAKFNGPARVALTTAMERIANAPRDPDTRCCELPLFFRQAADERVTPECLPRDLAIEDQDGRRVEWGEFFANKPSVLAFFYTRCDNPRKCIQTIHNLGAIHQALIQSGLAGKARIAAITYDPAYDTAAALKSYGNSRAFPFDQDTRMLRVPDDFDVVVRSFNLGVNFTGSQVNSHRIELFLLDGTGNIHDSFLRIQSDPKEIVKALRPLCADPEEVRPSGDRFRPENTPAGRDGLHRFQATSSIALAVLVSLIPKCPMCWMSYMSLIGIAGAESIPYNPWLIALLPTLLGVNLFCLFRSARSRNGYLPPVLSLAGAILVLLSIPFLGLPRWIAAPGLTLLTTGSLLQTLDYAAYNRLRLFFLRFNSGAVFHKRGVPR